ncbi:MAG TPA: hypothetical protein VFL14_09005, partial [Xanthomonadales bacterium]|nr:hypothetical protein [Xanthomonadales bacterium]
MSAAFPRRSTACFVVAFAFLVPFAAFGAPRLVPAEVLPDGSMVGHPTTGEVGISESVETIAARQAARGFEQRAPRRSIEHESRRHPVENPLAPEISRWPDFAGDERAQGAGDAPQTVSTQLLGATLNDTGAFPPDTMGTVGPTQFIVAVNGRIRSFNKTTGAADTVLNADTDVFFASVLSPQAGTFTSDPRIRYDRLSGRWFVIIIDVPAGTGAIANKVLLAVSNTPTITAATVWTFFSFQPSANFADYPTLGIDNNALYIGTNDFTLAGQFAGTSGFVVRKSSVTGGGPIVVTSFPGLVANGTAAGPFTPQGVDNYDSAATEGYFVGVDNATFSTLMIRRVSTPGGTPTVSANISLTVPTTTFPSTTGVPHLGNTGGTNGQLDALDDRLFAAHLRNGRLWTAHNIRVNSAGVASTAAGARNATRWYELQNLTTSPSVAQSGTIFDSAATNPLHYYIPSVMVSGQGHAAFGFSSSGSTARVNAATVGRLAGDAAGTTSGAPVNYTATTFDYNPPSDPGGPRRWGDYSYTSLDPCDDMTMWTIQEFTQATNVYGVQAAKLLAPAPTLSCASPTSVDQGTTTNITLTGTGFYNPPAGIDACRVAIAASAAGTGVTINTVTFNSATSLTLNVTVGASAATGARSLTVTNPDAQAASNTNCLTINAAAGTTIASLNRSSTDPVCATGNVSWQATFAGSVAGLAPGNFALSGGTGAAITGVTGSGTTWTVNANSGTAAASLGLSMANSGGTTPNVSNTPFSGQAFTVNALPTVANVSGGGAFCAGGAGQPVNLSGSQTGVNYQLRRDGNPVGAPFAGTGNAIAFGNQTVAGTYTVDATNATTTCAAPMSGNAVVTVNAAPTAFQVNGGGAFCSGGSGVAVGLAGSQLNVSYQLRRNGGNVGSPVNGTGNAISFGSQVLGGNYTVVATNASTCSSTMTGAVDVTVNETPSLNPVTPAAICTGGTTNIALTSTPPGATFAWSASLASGSVTGFA